MANVAIRIEAKPTYRDLQGKFTRANDALLTAKRDELRGEGRIMVDSIRGKIRTKTAPYSSVKLEQGVRFNTRQSGETISLNVTVPARAGKHRIQARFARALSFFFGRIGMQLIVPRRGGFRTFVKDGRMFSGKGYVDHPGGSMVPLLKPILEDEQREWSQTRGLVALRRISTRYTQELTK